MAVPRIKIIAARYARQLRGWVIRIAPVYIMRSSRQIMREARQAADRVIADAAANAVAARDRSTPTKPVNKFLVDRFSENKADNI